MKGGRERSSSRRSQHSSGHSRPPSILKSFAGSRSFLGSKSSLSSSSRKHLASESSRQFQNPSWQIVDDDGKDVTPQPLLQLDVSAIKKTHSNMFEKEGSAASTAIQSVFGHSLTMQTTASVMQQPFSNSVFGSISDIGTTGGSIIRSFADEHTAPKREEPSLLGRDDHLTGEERKASEFLTESDLERNVMVTLSETETIWLCDLDSSSVGKDSEEAEEVKTRNQEYQQLLSSRAGNDRYTQREAQTVTFALKSKLTQTHPVEKKSSAVWATAWDIYDTLESEVVSLDTADQMSEAQGSAASSRLTSSSKRVEPSSRASHRSVAFTQTLPPTAASSGVTPSTMVGNESSAVSTMEKRQEALGGVGEAKEEESSIDPTHPNEHPVLKLPSLIDSLRVVERAVVQNSYQAKQALYRGLPVVKDPDAEPQSTDRSFTVHKPHLERLWVFFSPLTKDKNASCMAWNKQNKDIVAVGYGNLDFGGKEEGAVCCWSLKNPEHSERVFRVPSAVTSLSFSTAHPNLLATGLYDGNIALFNLRSTSQDSILDTRDNASSHFGPVWQVGWVEKERSTAEDRTEVLVSVGADGRVIQWSIRKGFEGTQLMRIKRPTHLAGEGRVMGGVGSGAEKKGAGSKVKQSVAPAQQDVGVGSEALISQYSVGLGFDFWERDSNIYLAATDEGLIHKCSCSYNEQFLETYEGHSGSVYKVAWCPTTTFLFISCSADWSVKLWHHEKGKPLLSFTSQQKPIFDICWCPWNACMFATASEGRVEVWDLSYSVLDPFIIHKPSGHVKHCSLLFGNNAQVLLVGDSHGRVSVYQLRNVPEPKEDPVSGLLSAINKEM